MKLILTRHGETVENRRGILAGNYPARLSKKGISEAKKLAKRFKDTKIDIILSSDLQRAIKTAKEIKKYHPKIPLIQSKSLRERALGKWEGKLKTEVNKNNKPKDYETNTKLLQRAKKAILNFRKKYPNKTVLIVAHNGINKAILAVLQKKKRYPKQIIQHNACVNIIEINSSTPNKIHLVNCTKHLN